MSSQTQPAPLPCWPPTLQGQARADSVEDLEIIATVMRCDVVSYCQGRALELKIRFSVEQLLYHDRLCQEEAKWAKEYSEIATTSCIAVQVYYTGSVELPWWVASV